MDITTESNKVFNQIVLVLRLLLGDIRYSYQTLRSKNVLSKILNLSTTEMNLSVNSLALIDNYLNSANPTEYLDIELLLSMVIYVSQVIIVSSAHLTALEVNDVTSEENEFFLHVYYSNRCIPVLAIVKENINALSNTHSQLRDVVDSIIQYMNDAEYDSVRRDYSIASKFVVDLHDMINEGKDFFAESPLLINEVSTHFNIPLSKLNKSLRSLKLLDDAIRNVGMNGLEQGRFFLLIVTYVNEVVAKAINGNLEIVPKRSQEFGFRYYWTLKLTTSNGIELVNLISATSMEINMHNRNFCALKRMAESYIDKYKSL